MEAEVITAKPRAGRLPGEEPACLQIAVGILGILLLVVISLMSHWHWSRGTSAGVVALVAGLVLVLAAGFGGFKAHRQSSAGVLMLVGDILLTTSALAFIISSLGGAFSWAFPLGSIFTTLALFSDVATYRFRRAVRRAAA